MADRYRCIGRPNHFGSMTVIACGFEGELLGDRCPICDGMVERVERADPTSEHTTTAEDTQKRAIQLAAIALHSHLFGTPEQLQRYATVAVTAAWDILEAHALERLAQVEQAVRDHLTACTEPFADSWEYEATTARLRALVGDPNPDQFSCSACGQLLIPGAPNDNHDPHCGWLADARRNGTEGRQ